MKRISAQRRGIRPAPKSGFSLLEVIVSTAILSASTVMLLGLLSTGERHARQAERRVIGQMLCQSQLDELLAAPNLRQTVSEEPIVGYPEWVYSVKETPAEMPGLIRLQVSVTWVDPKQDAKPVDASLTKKTFEIVRLVRTPGKTARSASDSNAGLFFPAPGTPTSGLP